MTSLRVLRAICLVIVLLTDLSSARRVRNSSRFRLRSPPTATEKNSPRVTMLSLRRFGGWLKEHKSTFLTPLAIGAATATAISVSLYMLQDSLIYLSRRYGSADENAVAAFNGQMEKIGRPPVEPLSFTVPSVGAQRSFWIPPATSVPCASTSSSSSGIGEKETRGRVSVWILQGGNAMVALDWLAFLPYLLQRPSIEVQDEVPKEATGFLLVDYPSYGDCEGTPSPATCGETAETALLTLLEGLKEGNGSLGGVSEVELNFFGHSIGSASVRLDGGS
uniref:Uncharacterized protein n=1 Tax=Chromera velia CCMP2878 TaxID=1169474 RepID=A0A0G4HQC8_9ALVE|eukprot:Cvel_30194.t1-p1 / transcript=Cvel_30194.t1 / gene=Cvel_30194 / organism=Chromera_velia_CCMP2878 / gene_product=hypothetical protein / transcript_product=hypothetical protein / location=Cvel_scaffold4270:6822-8719(+) / protein_length=277 / sequence_SO=supercontig / SO=protein_coding / is_pseudo=false